MKFADLLEQHTDEIAALETWDNGKPYEQAAKIELPMCVRIMRYYAGECRNKVLSSFLYLGKAYTMFLTIYVFLTLFCV